MIRSGLSNGTAVSGTWDTPKGVCPVLSRLSFCRDTRDINGTCPGCPAVKSEPLRDSARRCASVLLQIADRDDVPDDVAELLIYLVSTFDE